MTDGPCIKLAHGGGGRLTDQLVKDVILKHLPHQPSLLDAAVMEATESRLAFTTDSYVVSPMFFPGGDIGKLAVFGTCNDLAMSGAKPVALSLALIVEEGLELSVLERVIKSVAEACGQAGVKVVTGDTKVVSRGQGDGLYINTAGIGHVRPGADMGFHRIETNDAVLLSGTIGDHGLAVMAQREGLGFGTPIVSDAANLAPAANALIDELGPAVRFMRDPTRGGLAGLLVDVAETSAKDVMVDEDRIPTHPATLAAAVVLGLELLAVANEGKFVAVLAPESADAALRICKRFEQASRACLIGRIGRAACPGRVLMKTHTGGRRIVQKPYGELLPRIC
jgi:hydrogenase expression/formation protein HypE